MSHAAARKNRESVQHGLVDSTRQPSKLLLTAGRRVKHWSQTALNLRGRMNNSERDDQPGEMQVANAPRGALLLPDEVVAALDCPTVRDALSRDPNNGPARIWVCGCVSKETAYSVAILLGEPLGPMAPRRRIQIFATGLDPASLETAGGRIYATDAQDALPPQRLEPYLSRVDEHRYLASQELRDTIVFASHELLRDPLFSKLDVIVCRMPLTPLNADERSDIVERFHFALKEAGLLVAAASEHDLYRGTLFEPVKGAACLHRRIALPQSERNVSMYAQRQLPNEERAGSKEEYAALNAELELVNGRLCKEVEQLTETHADFVSLVNTMALATLFLDTELRIKRFTPAIMSLFNVEQSDVGRCISDFATHFRDRTLVDDCRHALQTLARVERVVDTLDNTWYMRRAFPYPSLNGKQAVGVIVKFTDITEVIRARRAIIESEHWKRIVDYLPVGAVYVADGHVHVNRAAEALTGYASSEIDTPEKWFSKLYGTRANEAFALYEEKRIGFTDGSITTVTRKDGAVRSIEFVAARYDGGEIYVLRDMTEQRALQRQVLDLVNQEQRVVGEELHDVILQDLAGLGLIAASLAEQIPTASQQKHWADRLDSGLAELNDRVQRLAEGLLPTTVEPADLKATLESLAARTTGLHGVRCTVASHQPLAVDGHTAHELYRIAQEALTNVVKHAEARHVEIDLRQDDAYVTLDILDDGIGVDRGPQRENALGKRIMKYRCAMIGGRFDIHERPEGGTRVCCTLPRLKPPAV